MTKYKYTEDTATTLYIDKDSYEVSKENPIINVKVKLTKEQMKLLGLEEIE